MARRRPTGKGRHQPKQQGDGELEPIGKPSTAPCATEATRPTGQGAEAQASKGIAAGMAQSLEELEDMMQALLGIGQAEEYQLGEAAEEGSGTGADLIGSYDALDQGEWQEVRGKADSSQESADLTKLKEQLAARDKELEEARANLAKAEVELKASPTITAESSQESADLTKLKEQLAARDNELDEARADLAKAGAEVKANPTSAADTSSQESADLTKLKEQLAASDKDEAMSSDQCVQTHWGIAPDTEVLVAETCQQAMQLAHFWQQRAVKLRDELKASPTISADSSLGSADLTKLKDQQAARDREFEEARADLAKAEAEVEASPPELQTFLMSLKGLTNEQRQFAHENWPEIGKLPLEKAMDLLSLLSN